MEHSRKLLEIFPKNGFSPFVFVEAIILGVAAGLFLLALCICIDLRPKKKQKGAPARFIPLSDIQTATNGFDPVNQVGSGDFGTSYEGQGSDKRPWLVVKGAPVTKMAQAFGREKELVSSLSHDNLVPFIGYCWEERDVFLVYERSSGSTLHDLLKRSSIEDDGSTIPLTAQQRVDIALGAARALNYLHNEATPPVVHKDFNSTNIIINSLNEVEVSNYGHIKGLPGSPTVKKLRNSAGYLDPEYFHNFRATPAGDVFSFGVVLLELITGQLAETEDPKKGKKTYMNLEWAAKRINSGDISAVLDPRLPLPPSPAAEDALRKLGSLALKCVQRQSRKRPPIAAVVEELREIQPLLLLPPHASSSTLSFAKSASPSWRVTLAQAGGVEDLSEDSRTEVAPLFESQFSFKEITAATANFSSANQVASQRVGSVYRGRLVKTGTDVAVVRRTGLTDEVVVQTIAAVKAMRKVHHPNLVSLLGCSVGSDLGLLVFNFVGTPNLAQHLHSPDKAGVTPLSWSMRISIMEGVINGLLHLHNGCSPPIVHRGIAAETVLLSQTLHPQLADYGLDYFDESWDPELVNRRAGYAAPELATSTHATKQMDIFALGVLLLEMMTRIAPFDATRSPSYLADWARHQVWRTPDQVWRLLDPNIRDNYILVEVEDIASLALKCTALDPMSRPTISEVAEMFKKAKTVEELYKDESMEAALDRV